MTQESFFLIVPREVARDLDISNIGKLLFANIVDTLEPAEADNKDESAQYIRYYAEELGTSEAVVRRSLKDLSKKGYIDYEIKDNLITASTYLFFTKEFFRDKISDEARAIELREGFRAVGGL